MSWLFLSGAEEEAPVCPADRSFFREFSDSHGAFTRDDFVFFHFCVAHTGRQELEFIALEFFGEDDVAGERCDAVFAEIDAA
ncbi:MAG: hypothetical protein IIZ86_02925, partial [Firmicutes bacterium]|nr:hypothetical protein [Bacillota bacterium]